jgi:hypothetical protein
VGPEDGPQARPQWSRRPQAALEMVEKVLTDPDVKLKGLASYGRQDVCGVSHEEGVCGLSAHFAELGASGVFHVQDVCEFCSLRHARLPALPKRRRVHVLLR